MENIKHSDYGTRAESVLKNKVLRNPYTLLSMTLLFSAFTAFASIAMKLPHPGIIITLVGYFGLLYLTAVNRHSSIRILCLFALTGFMGYTLGPIVSSYLVAPNGSLVVTNALATTAIIFMSLSAYVLTTKTNLTFMGRFLMGGILLAFIGALGALIFNIPALSLVISAIFMLLMSGLILYETSSIWPQ